jgi:folate-binding protein YgfZ
LNADAITRLKEIRQRGFIAFLEQVESPLGMASPGVIRAIGADASTFLHSQVTNDVLGLGSGRGNFSARVTRTGHLEALFSLHVLSGASVSGSELQSYMVLPQAEVAALIDSFEGYIFSDRVFLSSGGEHYQWIAVQGTAANRVMAKVLGGEESPQMQDWGIRLLADVEEGEWPSFVVRRSLTGEPGYLVACAKSSDTYDRVAEIFLDPEEREEMALLAPDEAGWILEQMRIEAGLLDMNVDLVDKKRLLPETAMEQHTVSYTKGCYIGQEVIARVRTYGSVPRLLRGLVFPDAVRDWGVLLSSLSPGRTLKDAEGNALGVLASSCYSSAMDCPAAFAYLRRDWRTPGTVLRPLIGGKEITANVILLPFYHAPDSKAQAQQFYRQAIQVFAQGDEAGAQTLVERALRLDPGMEDAYEVMGVLLGRSGLYHEAIDIFSRLEEVAPHEPMVNTNLSLYYMKIGDKEAAENQASLAIRKGFSLLTNSSKGGPSAAEKKANQARAEEADARRKIGMFTEVLGFDPEDPVALFGLGVAQARLGQLPEAVETFEKAIIVQPKNGAVYMERGLILERLERDGEAIKVYRKGIEVASLKGDLQPLKAMEHRLFLLDAKS